VLLRGTGQSGIPLYRSAAGDTELTAGAVVNPEDKAKAYVPLARILKRTDGNAIVEEYAKEMRLLDPRYQGWTTRALLDSYTPRFERAYAVRLLGGTKAQIQAALMGR